MARLAFINLQAHGHVNPTLPVVRELVRRGHEVIYFLTEPFRAQCEGAGAQFRTMGELPRSVDPSRAPGNPLTLAATLLEGCLALLPGLTQSLARCDVDLVVHDSMCSWGRLAAQRLGLPSVCSTTTFALHAAMFATFRGRIEMLGALATGLPGLLRMTRAARRLEREHGVAGTALQDVLSNRGALTLVYTSRASALFRNDPPLLCRTGPGAEQRQRSGPRVSRRGRRSTKPPTAVRAIEGSLIARAVVRLVSRSHHEATGRRSSRCGTGGAAG